MSTVELAADCSRCSGLCCVALPFGRSADFAIDKPAGVPCVHLQGDFRCGIHDRLRPEGFPGCTVFDCFGAGQRVTRETFHGRDWRTDPALAASMFAALLVVRDLHEILLLLGQAGAAVAAARGTATGAGELAARVRDLVATVEALAAGTSDELAAVDVGRLRQQVGPVLGAVSAAVRRADPAVGGSARGGRGRGGRGRFRPGADLAGADLAGRDLRGADLRAAELRGAVLLATDLSGADLRGADLLGADLRDARLAGADLRGVLYLTGPQAAAARGDASTRLPDGLARPRHWPPGRRLAAGGGAGTS
ncbi:pentapeptide repeat-containing protein [Nakamurella endophytica]|uniref:Pentapeptide repeat-containing protein n=1 Tax=Nakamurella endophytica TaxID=1748367 RepID=A0A917TAV7_9ACTN|nr:pentapeptide repeat-containing protein [Nakamurella endophytica]GGM16434.1 hypothetical protein GCM10011594_40660 [Nakamurella endophytica]